MNDEVTTLKIEALEQKFDTLQKTIETMPDTISAKIDASVNLKIENAMQRVKLDFYKWFVPIILGLLFDLVFTFIK